MGSSVGSRSWARGLPANTWPRYAKRCVSWQSTARHGKSNTKAGASFGSLRRLTLLVAERCAALRSVANQTPTARHLTVLLSSAMQSKSNTKAGGELWLASGN